MNGKWIKGQIINNTTQQIDSVMKAEFIHYKKGFKKIYIIKNEQTQKTMFFLYNPFWKVF